MQKLSDPREVRELDPYDALSEDEHEIVKVKERLLSLEKERQDLIARLNRLNESKCSKKDPNLIKLEVPSSPPRPKRVKEIEKKTIEVVEYPKENENEIHLFSSFAAPSHSTSYFAEKLSSAKKVRDDKVQKRDDLLKRRVYTFSSIAIPKEFDSIVVDEVEEYSNMNISKRYIPKDVLNTIMQDIKVLRLSKLYAKVRPPKFLEPEYTNWLTLGVVTHKSDIKMTAQRVPNKYFSIKLTDFQYDIQLMIFGKTNVEKYYKLQVKDIIAVLNPEIYPWRGQSDDFENNVPSSKSFSLAVKSNYDCILEIGCSKDLGFCPAIVKSKNKACGAPLNKSLSEACSYHQELNFRSTNAKRVELNGNISLRAPTKDGIVQSANMVRSSKGVRIGLTPDKQASRTKVDDRKRLNFTSNNAYKAYFDDEFQNPDILQNLETKRRKVNDSRKDQEINRQLSMAISKNRSETISGFSSGFKSEMKKATVKAMNTGVIKNIGFDPTRGKMKSVLYESKKGGAEDYKSAEVAEILSIKKDNVDLKPSEQEIIRKRQKRTDVYNEIFNDGKGKVSNANIVESSDDDLEIV
ncbi:HHR240Wp [Eremothecium sinecaudum]|uniref:HHR240Wp n=1 Tax=Eremothecium sinecaudum TaxID=45286 RepID=A0A0X8HWW2_9SACH|nr:HHR240Wp [Eremothecium sinecaudum]AMD23009.1 HHR240Wp [Eremothecium sinecaudum]